MWYVNVWMICDVFREMSARDPIRNKLKGVDCDPQERDDVRMYQMLRNHSYLVECLWGSSLSKAKDRGAQHAPL